VGVLLLRNFALPLLQYVGHTHPRTLRLSSPTVRAKTAYCIPHKQISLKDRQFLNGKEQGRPSLMDKGTIDAFVDDRYSLKPDIIEADLCLKNWFNNGIADGRVAFANIASQHALK
jgi:hypothetical protein